MNFLVTGAGGFVGQMLCDTLVKNGDHVTAILRSDKTNVIASNVIYKNLDANSNFDNTLKSIDVVIHLAGRAHVLNDAAADVYKAYAEVNIEATKNLALHAAASGVKRFIFLSSVKVNGERTKNHAFNEHNKPNPEDDYGKTKLEAECVLAYIAAESKMEVVIIRPPLIYGKGVKANFKNLIKLCQLKLPLPFGAIQNKRSMVYIENLIDFIVVCSSHPLASGEIFLISDDNDVSTSELIQSIRKALSKSSLLISIPSAWIIFALKLIGKESIANRLCGDLQVDISKAKTLLGWKPPFTFEQGIKNTIQEK